MTLILGAKDRKGRVFIGADKRGSDGHSYIDGQNKLIPQHNYVVGYSGSFRVGQLIRYNEDKFQPVASDADMFAWVNALRDLLMNHGYSKESGDEDEPMHNSVLLILATPQDVYTVDQTYQFYSMTRYAVGCGWQYGLGHFDAQSASVPMSHRIQLAIKGAATIIQGVSPDSDVMEVKSKTTTGGKAL